MSIGEDISCLGRSSTVGHGGHDLDGEAPGEGWNLTCPAIDVLERETRYKNPEPIERETLKRQHDSPSAVLRAMRRMHGSRAGDERDRASDHGVFVDRRARLPLLLPEHRPQFDFPVLEIVNEFFERIQAAWPSQQFLKVVSGLLVPLFLKQGRQCLTGHFESILQRKSIGPRNSPEGGLDLPGQLVLVVLVAHATYPITLSIAEGRPHHFGRATRHVPHTKPEGTAPNQSLVRPHDL